MRYLSLEEIHRVQLDMLQDFHSFCMMHGIRYSLIGGTLLGACREGGFIPWDDDVDVAMPRPDYDKLVSLAGCLPDHYQLLTYENSDWPQGFCKLQNLTIRAQEPALQGVIDEYLWIDIFPYDGASTDARERLRTINTIQDTIRAISRRTYTPLSTDWSPKAVIKRAYQCFFGNQSIINDLKHRLSKEIDALDYGGSSLVCCYVNGVHSAEMVVEKCLFEQTELVEFEGLSLCRSVCYDVLLQQQFGAYWELPPVGQRVPSHTYRAWRVEKYLG